MPRTKTKIYVNVGEPESAMVVSQLPTDGVGLAREEFIITSSINEHPLAMIKAGREKEFIKKLSAGIAKIAACFYPRTVIVRLSDFKSNEYRGLKGGAYYEPDEENPMLGWRGASRYVTPEYEAAFRLELKSLKKCIDEKKLKNIKIMIPFCRTIEEARKVIKQLIHTAHLHGRIVGICGQAPSDYPDFLKFLVDEGIDSISVNPDVAIQTRINVAKHEKEKRFI